MSNNNNTSGWNIVINNEVIAPSAKVNAIRPEVWALVDQFTLIYNAELTIKEKKAEVRKSVPAILKSGVTIAEIVEAMKLAGFSDSDISKTLLSYGIKRNAGKQNKGEKSKAVQLLAEMLKEVAEENANTMEQAVAALRRAADQLRDEAKSKKSK